VVRLDGPFTQSTGRDKKKREEETPLIHRPWNSRPRNWCGKGVSTGVDEKRIKREPTVGTRLEGLSGK